MATIKSFEDFLDRMQGLLDNAKKQGQIIVPIKDLENAFPELKESEDERYKSAIRKMYSFLPNKPKYIGDVSVEDMFAWLEKQDEQKPAEWSEEDIMRIDNLIAIIENRGYPDYVEYLEKLKYRVQPKQEWNEEDESNIESAIYYIRREPYLESIVEPIVAWLRNLKDRYTWKPSLSQLNALGIVAKGNPPDDIEEIKSLYNDLHKLIN